MDKHDNLPQSGEPDEDDMVEVAAFTGETASSAFMVSTFLSTTIGVYLWDSDAPEGGYRVMVAKADEAEARKLLADMIKR